jgi:uncharacterized protein YecE (DUF72 family)
MHAAAFCTAELNSSFYRRPRPSAFSAWRHRLPEGFLLSVKAPRGLTHGRRLYAPETWLQRIAAGWHEPGARRAVLLVQLAPSHQRDDARLAHFLQLVPDWIRVAVEFRHASWQCEEIFCAAGSPPRRVLRDERRRPADANAVRNARSLRAMVNR